MDLPIAPPAMEDQPADRRQPWCPLDPLDAKTSRHAPECEFASETDPAVLRILLQVKPADCEGYSWVTCNACEASVS